MTVNVQFFPGVVCACVRSTIQTHTNNKSVSENTWPPGVFGIRSNTAIGSAWV